MKKVQPNYKSISADPRIDSLEKEDQWWCYLVTGWRWSTMETSMITATTLADLAVCINNELEECWPDEGPEGRVPLTEPNPAR
jgi:hypothetical protein